MGVMCIVPNRVACYYYHYYSNMTFIKRATFYIKMIAVFHIMEDHAQFNSEMHANNWVIFVCY